MSVQTGIGVVSFNRKMGSYTTALQCSEGDLSQLYTGDATSFTCIPDFEAAGYVKPVLNFVVVSSRVAEGTVTPTNIRWYFNGALISFGTDGVSTGNLAGYFEMITPTAANGYMYPGLRVLKNLPGIGNFAPINIRVEGQVAVGTDTDTIQASYTIDIRQNTGGTSNIVKVAAVSPVQGFVISSKSGSVQLKAVAYRNGTTLVSPASLTHKWFRMSGGAWVEITSAGPETISGDGGSILTVHEADVMVQGMYKCEVYDSGKMFGQDVEKVLDASDCYEVLFHYTPADATISDDPAGNHSVNARVSVISRKTQGTVVAKDASQAKFTVIDPAGNILNTGENPVQKNSQDVTLAMVQQAGTDVQIICEVDVP